MIPGAEVSCGLYHVHGRREVRSGRQAGPTGNVTGAVYMPFLFLRRSVCFDVWSMRTVDVYFVRFGPALYIHTSCMLIYVHTVRLCIYLCLPFGHVCIRLHGVRVGGARGGVCVTLTCLTSPAPPPAPQHEQKCIISPR